MYKLSDADADKLAHFVHNQRARIDFLKQDNSIFRSGLHNEEEQWGQIQQIIQASDGDPVKISAINRELDRVKNEKQISEQDYQHLNILSGTIDEIGSLPDIRERLRRIEAAQRNLLVDQRGG